VSSLAKRRKGDVTVRDETKRLKSEIKRLKGEIRKGRAQLAEFRRTAADWKARFREKHRLLRQARHLVPSPAVLETLLPTRLAAAQERARRPDAVARHREFLRIGKRYAQAVEAYEAGHMSNAQSICVGALKFWVPLEARLPERVARAQKQGLPLRVISNTREVASGRVMLDVGGNLGRTAIPRVVLGDVEIAYAAEPHPENYDCLVWSVLENGLAGLVLPDQVAISSRDGTATLLPSRFAGGHALREPGASPENKLTLEVPCCQLDTWTEHLKVNLEDVNFIKVDVQGWEPKVLRGASRILSRQHIAWQFEISPGRLKRAGSCLEELLDLMDLHFDWFVDLDKTRIESRLAPIDQLRSRLSHLESERLETDIVLWQSGGLRSGQS